MHTPVISPHIYTSSKPSRRELDINFTLSTTNEENLPEVEDEVLSSIIETPRDTSRNPNICNDNPDYRGVKWMENHSKTKRDQNSQIPRRT